MKKNYFQINEIAYSKVAEEYEKTKSKNRWIKREAINFINSIQKISNNPKILEIGPGGGIALKEFEKRGFNTCAVDLSQKMIEVSKRVAPNTKYIKGNFLEYNSENNFDGIFSRFVLHLFSEQDAYKFVEKAYNLLKPKGIFFASTLLHEYPREGLVEKKEGDLRVDRYKKKWTKSELENLLKESPFEIYELNIYNLYNKENKKAIIEFQKE